MASKVKKQTLIVAAVFITGFLAMISYWNVPTQPPLVDDGLRFGAATIAFDNATTEGNTSETVKTYSHTVNDDTSGILFVTATGPFTAESNVQSVTYAGEAMTLIASKSNGANNRRAFLFYLVGPTVGINNVVLTFNTTYNSASSAMSYTGASQTGVPDSFAVRNATEDPFTQSTTVIATGSWLVGIAQNNEENYTAGTGLTIRGSAVNGMAAGDSNGTVSTGSQSMSWDVTSSFEHQGVIASFAPDEAGAAAGFEWGQVI